MAFLTPEQEASITKQMATDEDYLLKLFKSKMLEYIVRSEPHAIAKELIQKGYEFVSESKLKTKVQIRKDVGSRFEEKIWCMFYRLGFRILNLNDHLVVKWGEASGDHKQIDVLAVKDDAIFVVECKATDSSKSRSFKNEIDLIEHTREGITKALKQIYGHDKKIKFILATENYRFSDKSDDLKRMKDKKIFHLDDNAYKYIDSLIVSYKGCALHQFYGLMFRNELINNEKIRVPALRGTMGKRTYYMLSIEPATLLKLGFVLHRTRVNKETYPTYQRLLVSKRLKGIGDFINKGGYFPNSIIVNFCSPQKKVYFEPAGKASNDSDSRFGTLVIPNMYSIAYIIDGQHRLYGYADSDFRYTNTIPVVAFVDMEPEEQLKIFMEINQNQKAVSPSLRLDLQEDLDWDSKRADSRMGALRSSIIKSLASDNGSVLYNKISVGEDKAKLTFQPFENALRKSSLLPTCNAKSYKLDTDVCMYDISNSDIKDAMDKAKDRVRRFVGECYNFMHDNLDEVNYNTFVENNRGTYGFITLIGSLHKHLVQSGVVAQHASVSAKMEAMIPYLQVFADYLMNLPEEDRTTLESIFGKGADTKWLRMFQKSIKKLYPEFQPDGLDAWLETQDKDLQKIGHEAGKQILAMLYNRVIEKAQELHGDSWETALSAERKACKTRILDKEDEDPSFNVDEADWTDFIQFEEVRSIIKKNWNVRSESNPAFVTFEKEFTIDIGEGTKTKTDKMKWLEELNACRPAWESSKGKTLSKEQVNKLCIIKESLIPEGDTV